jgi:hypothetical protein
VTFKSWNASVATILLLVLVEINASALVGSIVKLCGEWDAQEELYIRCERALAVTSTLHLPPPLCRAISLSAGESSDVSLIAESMPGGSFPLSSFPSLP